VSIPRILIVEDDAPVASVLERGLALAGFGVALANDAAAGETRWRTGGFAAVILDVMLPDSSGVELCARMRGSGDATPVVLLTARDDDALRQAAFAAGASAYITKPFVYVELMRLIRELTSPRIGGDESPH
jgi:DNA-binding response OmpR family regulator